MVAPRPLTAPPVMVTLSLPVEPLMVSQSPELPPPLMVGEAASGVATVKVSSPVPPLNVAGELKALIVNESLPALPLTVNVPLFPLMVKESLPAPPFKVSVPLLPLTVKLSLPALLPESPVTVKAALLALMT